MNQPEYFDVEQGTDAWFEARLGIPTASEMSDVMAQGQGLTRKSYMYRLAAEIITGSPCQTWGGNADTERGKLQEPIARELYTKHSKLAVTQTGFYRLDRLGCSPDGLAGEGGVEIKSKRADLHIAVLVRDDVPPEHIKQIQTSLLVTGRPWWDFVSYSPGLPLFIRRVFPDPELQALIREATNQFNAELDALVKKIGGMY